MIMMMMTILMTIGSTMMMVISIQCNELQTWMIAVQCNPNDSHDNDELYYKQLQGLIVKDHEL